MSRWYYVVSCGFLLVHVSTSLKRGSLSLVTIFSSFCDLFCHWNTFFVRVYFFLVMLYLIMSFFDLLCHKMTYFWSQWPKNYWHEFFLLGTHLPHFTDNLMRVFFQPASNFWKFATKASSHFFHCAHTSRSFLLWIKPLFPKKTKKVNFSAPEPFQEL